MSKSSTETFLLNTTINLNLIGLNADFVAYRGKSALQLTERDTESDRERIAIILDSHFKNGVIEAEVAGKPRANAPDFARGFVGIAFHVARDGGRFEYFFIRPTNGRADDQLRRNHSTQYCSHPDHPWYRLREENPGVYESYTDLIPGEWTKIKIFVSGLRAELYVNGTEQPCLIVKDLKLGEAEGQIALWVGSGTEAYFSELNVRHLE